MAAALELVGISKELGEDALHKLSQMPLASFLQISLTKMEKGGAAECEMKLDPARHGNPNGTVQGGSLSTLADITTSFAVVALGAETCT
jgi:acyl-coenzyme A thioesterase PaaI-like protein